MEDDGFIYDNLCRILPRAGKTEELVWVLESARWIVVRLQNMGIRNVEQDVAIGIQTAEGKGSEQKEVLVYLKLIAGAVCMSFSQMVENPYEAWFQLYGRMIWYADQCERSRWFAREIEQNAPRPLVKASVAVLNDAGGRISESLRIERGTRVLCVCHTGDAVRMLWKDGAGMDYVSQYERSSESRKTYKLDTAGFSAIELSGDRNISEPLGMQKAYIVIGAFSGNLNKLVTEYADKKVVVWDIASGYKVGHSIKCVDTGIRRLFPCACDTCEGYENDGGCHVSVSDDGRTVIRVSWREQLYIWNVGNKKNAQSTMQRIEESGYVKIMDLSVTGERVAYTIEPTGRHLIPMKFGTEAFDAN